MTSAQSPEARLVTAAYEAWIAGAMRLGSELRSKFFWQRPGPARLHSPPPPDIPAARWQQLRHRLQHGLTRYPLRAGAVLGLIGASSYRALRSNFNGDRR